jgi:WD40 repeat protein
MKPFHINCFCISEDEKYIFAGDKLGRIVSLDMETFTIQQCKPLHSGTVQTMISRKSDGLFVSLGKDFNVNVMQHTGKGDFDLIRSINIRDASLTDGYQPTICESQAVTLHPTQNIVASRAGNHKILEIDFSENEPRILSAVRAFAERSVITLKYPHHGEYLLAGGGAGLVSMLKNGKVLETLSVNETQESVHWFEEIDNNDFLIASDSRNIIRYKPLSNEKLKMSSEKFSRDDFEHITFNHSDKRIYASSFDRHIYEIDLEKFNVKQTIVKLPFKIRWIKSLDQQPHILIAQVRNGSLYKIDTQKREILAALHTGTPSIWSGAEDMNGNFHFSGECTDIFHMKINNIDQQTLIPNFSITKSTVNTGFFNYAKRIVSNISDDLLMFGTSRGEITFLQDEKIKTMEFSSAIRDLSLDSESNSLFSCDEDGHLRQLDLKTLESKVLLKSEQPLWALAHTSKYVAVGERLGKMYILDKLTGELIDTTTSRLPKRMKWLDETTLLVTSSEKIDLIRKTEAGWTHELGAFKGTGNTIEDFSWDQSRKYLIGVTYNKKINLFDLQTKKLLDSCTATFDFIKGCSFFHNNKDMNSLDFIIYGRFSTINHYRIHDEQIIPLQSIPLKI